MMQKRDMLWTLTDVEKVETNMSKYMNWLHQRANQTFLNYQDLHTWSIKESALFWESIANYYDVKLSHPPNEIKSNDPMPDTKWFEGASLNYAAQIFAAQRHDQPALKYCGEDAEVKEMSWEELSTKVNRVAFYLKSKGIVSGDRVVGYLPHVPEAIIAFLACASIGAVWSSCSPDFGVKSVIERFQLISPKAIFAVNGYQYNGKQYDISASVDEIVSSIPSLIFCVTLDGAKDQENEISWGKLMQQTISAPLTFSEVPFDHPLYILFSSGTTGKPKAIAHGHGGITLEHLKYLGIHNDVRVGETYFWYTTTGWMMWNFSISALMLGATLFIYDGSPTFGGIDQMWRLAKKLPIHHFGTSAPFLISCMKEGLHFESGSFPDLRSISTTGSPLPGEAFDYVYKHIKADVWLASMSGGTDICTAWVGANPLLPVYKGCIQCVCLGCAMESWDEKGQTIFDEVGEMVVTQPMPSMPIFFWDDANNEKYKGSYFEHYEGVWRHGDWVKIYTDGSLEIMGRSDATLNRHGIRIGTAEIYRVLDTIVRVKDSLIVNLELKAGKHFMPLFIVLREGEALDDKLVNEINQALKSTYSPRYVPDQIIVVPDIPYTISGKKLEAPVKKILLGISIDKAANVGSMRNPESLDFFVDYSQRFFQDKLL